MLTKLSNENFDVIYKIFEDSFPLDEYRPYDEQKALLQKDNYSIYSLLEDDGDIKAFIAIWEFDDFVFVEHFAVSPAYRNSGLGSHILSELKNQFKGKRLCLEVELPIGEMPIRRIGFYKRNGFFFNDYQYIQPPISKGKNEIPLKIMTTISEIDEKTFVKMRDLIHRVVYNKK